MPVAIGEYQAMVDGLLYIEEEEEASCLQLISGLWRRQ